MSPVAGADFSGYHKPVSEMFAKPDSTSEWKSFALTTEQVQFYKENGYLSGVRLLNAEHLETLHDELASFLDAKHVGQEFWYEFHADESQDPGSVLFHALGAWRLRAGFHDLLWNPAFTVPASQLLDGAVRFWHDQLFCKPAKHGGVVAWHQDYSYWQRTEPMAHLTCWMGLDDSNIDNGCLQYIPGSHRWNLLEITGLAGDMNAIENLLTEEQWEQFQNPVPIELKAGECSFHHPLMVHGSYANTSDHPRRAAVLNVVRNGVRSTSNQPLLAGTPAIKSGDLLDGQFFPLLYDPNETEDSDRESKE